MLNSLKVNLLLLYFTILVIKIVIFFYDKKNDTVKFDIIPKTNEDYIAVTYSCIRFSDSYRFLSSSLYKLVETFVDKSHKSVKKN